LNGEYRMQVIEMVASLNDPRSARALARNAGSSNATLALASFGERGVLALLQNFRDVEKEKSLSPCYYCLRALARIFGGAGAPGGHDSPALSASTRQAVVQAAWDGLRSHNASTVIGGIDLALALNEPSLVERVRALAREPEVWTALAADNAYGLAWVRRRATEGLSKASAPP